MYKNDFYILPLMILFIFISVDIFKLYLLLIILMMVVSLGISVPYLLLGVLMFHFMKSPNFNFFESTDNYI